MTRKPDPKRDDPEQSQRFIDTAKEIGADETDEALEQALAKISASARSPKVDVVPAKVKRAKLNRND